MTLTPDTIEKTNLDIDSSNPNGDGFALLIYNNESTSFDAVINALMKGTKCDFNEAAYEANLAHQNGEAVVHLSSKEECDEASKPLAEVGVKTCVIPAREL